MGTELVAKEIINKYNRLVKLNNKKALYCTVYRKEKKIN